MPALVLMCLAIVFFLTAVISVVTGGTSLITVPVMMQCGVEPHIAVATNMLALIFLSLGGSLPFLKGEVIPWRRLPALTGLTLLGSTLGAFVLVAVPTKAMPIVIGTAMIVVAAFSLLMHDAGVSARTAPSWGLEAAGHCATFFLGVYGGFFSGGYAALLTIAYVALFRMTFVEAVATTKILNFASSLVATMVFARQGLIDWKLGFLLGGASFAGAILGAILARRLSDIWLRWIFLAVVIALGAKTLIYDARWSI